MTSRKIFYFSFDHDKPSGGVKEQYRHVDILNRNNFDAYVLHPKDGYKASWFEHDTRTIGIEAFGKLFNTQTDFVVVPEDLGTRSLNLPCKKVIFNQNAFYGFGVFGAETPQQYTYLHPDVKAVFTVSEHNSEWLRLAYPDIDIHRLPVAVDTGRT